MQNPNPKPLHPRRLHQFRSPASPQRARVAAGAESPDVQSRAVRWPNRRLRARPIDASPDDKPVHGQAVERAPGNGVSRAAAQPRRQYDDLYAALDLGTNNCRLLVAQPTRPGQFRVVDAFSRIVRLGEGLDSTGELSAGAMDRAVEALKICAGKLKSRPVRRQRLIATEACRSARNGTEFLERVERETGLQLEIVTRETEARLAVAGCSSLVGRDTDGLVLFDIGGGSSEIAMIDLTENRSNRLANHIKAWTSLPVGVVTLSERHGGCMVTREVFEAMVAEVDDMLSAFVPPSLPAFSELGDDRMHLLGTSGTVTTLAGLHLELPRYDRRKVDGLWLSNSEVDRMLDMLLSWDFDARAANPCIGADRADLVLAGCAILQSIRKRWPSQRMRVADRGLREGLLNEMMAADGAWRGRGRSYRNRHQRPHPGAKS
jgi:exopolyphosphatase/guanosine-5'-triphosphate,3'-diphosphate pyrophosphatase